MRISAVAMSWLWPVLVGVVLAVLVAFIAMSTTAVAVEPSGGAGGLGGGFLMAPVGGGAQAAAEEQARLSSPEALAEEARSRTEYAGYGREAAVALAKRVFGIGTPGWTPPQDQGSGKITGYVGETMAQELLPNGQHVLVASSLPLRSTQGSGQQRPVSLTLAGSGGAYTPENPIVPLVIGKSPAEGVSFQGGVRIAPAAHGTPESPEVVGNRVFYPGTAKDTDFMLEPRPLGVEASWQLLSAEAAGEDELTFSLPAGAQLVMSKEIEGAAEVILEGQRLLMIMPAKAVQADGVGLQTSYSINGNTLTTHVDLEGNVDFPVEVDPVVWQKYGGGSGYWGGWVTTDTERSGKFLGGQGNLGIYAEVVKEAPFAKAFANWSLFAPGFAAGEGSLTRMDVTEMEHGFGSQSNVEAGIIKSNGTDPVWTYDGENPADTKEGMLLTSEEFKGRPVAFCAESGGGYDGGSKPLCNESYGGEYFRFTVDTWEVEKLRQFEYIEANTARFLDTSNIKASASSSAELKGQPNVLSGNNWFSEANGALEAIGSDPAFGVAKLAVSITNAKGEGSKVTREYASEGFCSGILCAAEEHQELLYKNFTGGLPNGDDTIKIEAGDASGLTAIWSSTVQVDHSPPHGLTVTGANVKGKTISITEGPAGDQINVEASDGEGSVPSSGIHSLRLYVDKRQVGVEQGYCSPGPCSGKGTWALNGRELGAGLHTLVARATDNAGNVEEETYELVVHAASPVAMGPGSVNPQSGDFALERTDASLQVGGGGVLAVTQHYDSRNVNEGAEGSLGPQWTLGLGSLASLEVVEAEGKDEGVMVAGPEGPSFFKPKEGGGFESANDPALTLTQAKEGKEFVLEDKAKGYSTTFTLPAGAKEWMPTVVKGPVATNTITDTYRSVEEKGKMVVEPTEELAPHGSRSCPPELAGMQKGCRALLFSYGNEHTEQPEASGEGKSQWGWYANRLMRVSAVAWNNSASEMQEVPVAEFSYDKQGRLRAEWDPRIKPALKTTYGYDSENHVTAVSSPGQQPWLMVYGTTAEDASAGRLVKVTRPKASTALWGGLLPENTEAPVISGAAGVGVRLSVSEGKWSNSALVYGFQWERCNKWGFNCVPIAGATNANYTPTSSDLGSKLEAQVTAENAGGAVSATTSQTSVVLSNLYIEHTQSIDSSAINAVSCVPSSTDCVISDSKGAAQYATNVSASGNATWNSWAGPGASPSEALSCPTSGLCLIAAGSHEGGGSLYYATSLGGAWKEAYKPSYGVEAVSCVSASLCVAGQSGNGYMAGSAKPASTSWTQVQQGSAMMRASSCLSSGFCVIADTSGYVHVATSKSSIESGTWTQTDVDGSTGLTGVACLSTSSCIAVDGRGNAIALTINGSGSVTSTSKSDIDGFYPLTGISCPTSSLCAAVDSQGDLLVSTNAGSSWSKPNEIAEDLTSVSCASKTLCLTAATNGEVIAFNPTEEARTEGAQQSPQPGSTIEYDVPVSGSGAPYAMGHSEVEKWGQKDYPAEASEIFPPEHPQGWPASGKTGGMVSYTDTEAQTVNVANPSEGISTTEYQEGDVIRALSADNRKKALEEANSVEAAEKLATISKYSSAGNELTEVTGPEHKVKLTGGEEVNARNHVRYFYDEGAPDNSKGEPEENGLVTRTTDGALLASGEEKDLRTTLTGYSGQEGLGWTLRAPTSTTAEPGGADLVSSTKYNKETGDVEETRTPGGNAETVSPPVFSSVFGESGSGNGQFKEASAVAVAPSGESWVDDRGDGRVEKFSSTGSFLGAYESKLGKFSGSWGIAVSPKTEDVFVSDSGHNCVVVLKPNGEELRLFGQSGEGALSGPTGISVTPAGVVLVADYGANKVEEFSEEGKYIASFGEGHLKEPSDAVLDNGVIYATSAHSVMMFAVKGGAYLGSFGSQGHESGQFEAPSEIVANPGTGDLFVVDGGNERVEELNPAGKFLAEFGSYGSKNGQFKGISGLAVTSAGVLYTSETVGDRVQKFLPPEAGGARTVYSTQWGKQGSGAGEFLYPAEPAIEAGGDVLVTDNEADTIQKFSPTGKYLASYGSKGSGEGQLSGPTGLTVNQSTSDMYVAECGNKRIQELSPEGKYIRAFGQEQLGCPGAVALDASGDAWTVDMTKNLIVEYSPTGGYMASYGSTGSGHLQFNRPTDIKILGSDVYVTDTGNDRVEILNLKGEYVGQIGTEGNGGGQFNKPEGLAFNSASDMFVLDSGNNRMEEFNPEGHYMQSIATHGVGEGLVNAPQGIAVTPAGDMYVADAGNHRIEKWIPDSQAVHDTKTVYYTATANSEHKECGEHPEWEGMICRAEPVAQPTVESGGPPQLPVLTTEYNMYDQPVKTTETIGSNTRTKTTTYEAERPIATATTASVDTAVPAVKDKYSETTGQLVEQSTESGGKTLSISRAYNTLGEMESYTDTAGNLTSYSYDQYGRPIEVNYDLTKLDGLTAKQNYTYSETTGALTELEDSSTGTSAFKASYDAEGNLTSETYPNNMTATYAYNSIGEGVSLAYKKNSHCTGSECEWFKDTLTPSIHGETLTQESSLATDHYTYENLGRLTEVQETPAGEGCTTRIYAYNEESYRTSLTSRKPGGEGKCASEGGETQRHVYDEANRLTDENIKYEQLGNITKLPAADAGGSELASEYYADGQVKSQTQSEKTNTYTLDPENRTLETQTIKGLENTTTISHYAAESGTPSWTYNQTTAVWTRNVMGIGGLVAVQEAGKETTLQLRDLQGNIIGTASLNETTGKPLTLERTTEYGVPVTTKPLDKYGWTGTSGNSPELPDGEIVQDGSTFVPQTGAPLQTEGTPLPAALYTAIPYVITATPTREVKGEEARSKTTGGGAPSGNVPESGGEQTTCSGMKACEAHYKKYVREGCIIKVRILEEKSTKDVWGKGWAFCPGKTMNGDAKLDVCLNAESTDGYSPIGPEAVCGPVAYGWVWPHQLYTTVHGAQCGADISYVAVAGFAPSASAKEKTKESKAWECGEGEAEAISNVIWFVFEQDSGAPAGGGGDG